MTLDEIKEIVLVIDQITESPIVTGKKWKREINFESSSASDLQETNKVRIFRFASSSESIYVSIWPSECRTFRSSQWGVRAGSGSGAAWGG